MNLLKLSIEAARARCTLGEISGKGEVVNMKADLHDQALIAFD